jgi:hypothetical protein
MTAREMHRVVGGVLVLSEVGSTLERVRSNDSGHWSVRMKKDQKVLLENRRVKGLSYKEFLV